MNLKTVFSLVLAAGGFAFSSQAYTTSTLASRTFAGAVVNPAPEPSTLALLGFGSVVGIFFFSRRKR